MASRQLLPETTCPLCRGAAPGQPVTLRSGNPGLLLTCDTCRLSFFDRDPTAMLVDDQLDHIRLAEAGMQVPDIVSDFTNGERQSQEYIREYLTPRDRRILEVGCSWGYFLQSAKIAGAEVTGVEVNPVRRRYVQDQCHLPCYSNLSELVESGAQFDKIFLFYVMEYFVDPLAEFTDLCRLLAPEGELIAITPNHDDVLLSTWHNQAYSNFVYDACAINYFTPESIAALASRVTTRPFEVTTRQGYSFANHLNWQLHGKPMPTGCVGKDRIVESLQQTLDGAPLGQALADLLASFDERYRDLIEQAGQGNQVRLRIGAAHAEV